jgi:PAS domain S-box-containing protein
MDVRGKDRSAKALAAAGEPLRLGRKKEAAGVREAQLASIIASSTDAIYSKDLKGAVTSWNFGAERVFGYAASEIIGKPGRILIPPGREDEEPFVLARIRRGERVEPYDTVRRRKDGTLVDVSISASPVSDGSGRVTGAAKIARDISERRRLEQQQQLLLREMDHRIKNLFAVAGAIVSLSARSAKTPAALASAVQERLAALARAHELTLPNLAERSQGQRKATTLETLIETIVAPYRPQGHAPIAIGGPEVPVGGRAVMDIALLLHETATNAAKYGALSSPEGRLDIRWSICGDDVLLTWRERGGPVIAAEPEAEGFGSLLTRLTAAGPLACRVARNWENEGLTVTLSMPLARLSE